MDPISLPIVHPAFEKLKRSGSWLHLAAGLLILTHAISHIQHRDSSPVYFWCLLLISLDILILFIAGRDLAAQLPRVNLFFRLVEILFFLGIGLFMLTRGNTLTALIHISLSICYTYLFYCERNLQSRENLLIHHIGLTLPGLPESKFLLWTHINKLEASYNTIQISTSQDSILHFELRKNLDFAELEQIHEFCRHYLGAGDPGR